MEQCNQYIVQTTCYKTERFKSCTILYALTKKIDLITVSFRTECTSLQTQMPDPHLSTKHYSIPSSRPLYYRLRLSL